MGVGQSQENQADYKDKLFNKLGALKQNKALMPLAAAMVFYQIKDLKPDQVDLSRADVAQRTEFAKMKYDENFGEWFYDGDCNNTNVLLDQVSNMAEALDCDKWLVLYTFIRTGYNVDETKQYCADNKVNMLSPVFDIPLKNDQEGWRVMYEKILELGNVAQYVPPAGYKIKHLMSAEQQFIQHMMNYGHGHNHDDQDQDQDQDDQDQIDRADQDALDDLDTETVQDDQDAPDAEDIDR
jgi:hypothetical protein